MFSRITIIFITVLVAMYLKNIISLKVIPERATVTYINEKYVYKNATVKVRRYVRRGDYYVNIEGTIKTEFGNNVSMEVIFFEFLHNEYKRSFVEMKFNKICDSIDQDPYIGKTFKLIGLKCPIPPGTYRLMNMSIPMQDFPNVWPYERCKAEVTMKQNIKNGDVIASADLYVSVKQKIRHK